MARKKAQTHELSSSGRVRLDPTKWSKVAEDWFRFVREKKGVVGQDEIIEEIAKALERVTERPYNSISLVRPRRTRKKPICALLIPGPSGVGKTFIPKLLNEFLFGTDEIKIQLNGADFIEEHKVSAVIGTSQGYEGYGDDPLITQDSLDLPAYNALVRRRIRNEKDHDKKERRSAAYQDLLHARSELSLLLKQDKAYTQQASARRKIETVNKRLMKMECPVYDPDDRKKSYLSVVLVDEVEKAHRAFHNMFLAPLDKDGMLRTSAGPVSFPGTFFFFTSNIGYKEIEKYVQVRSGKAVSMGFSSSTTGKTLIEDRKEFRRICVKAAEECFESSFRRRVKMIPAYPLTKDQLLSILEREIEALRHSCSLDFEIDDRVKEHIVSLSLDKMEKGASILEEIFESDISDKIDSFIKTHQVKKGDHVRISLETIEGGGDTQENRIIYEKV